MIKVIFYFLILLSANTAYSADRISCSYNFGNNEINVEVLNNKTKVEKVFRKNNIDHRIVISDINNLSEINDYYTKSNSRGHKITYSLNCKK